MSAANILMEGQRRAAEQNELNWQRALQGITWANDKSRLKSAKDQEFYGKFLEEARAQGIDPNSQAGKDLLEQHNANRLAAQDYANSQSTPGWLRKVQSYIPWTEEWDIRKGTGFDNERRAIEEEDKINQDYVAGSLGRVDGRQKELDQRSKLLTTGRRTL